MVQVCGDAKVSGTAQVCGDAQVFGDAKVSGNAKVYGIKRSDGCTFCFVPCKDGLMRVQAGCRDLTMPEARLHWGKKHPKHEETAIILDCLEALGKFRGYV